MDVNNLENWVSQPDVCRCCLSASGTWDLTASYVTEAGIKEVFSEILQECYCISLTHLTEFSPSVLVCATCVGHLRAAARFRKQVLVAERYFSEYLKKNECMERVIKYELQLDYGTDDFPGHMEEPKADNKEMVIKAEPDLELSADDLSEEMEASKIDNSPSKNHIKAISKQNKTIRKRRKHAPAKRKTRMADSDYDSDSPLTKLSKKDLNSDINNAGHDVMENKYDRVEETDNKLDLSKADAAKLNKKPPKVLTESQIENFNLRSNIILVLKNSTILPFRAIGRYKYVCFYCNKTYLYFKDIKVHIEEKHHDVSEKEISRRVSSPQLLVKAEVSDIRCKLCDANFKSMDSLVEHLVKKHDKVFHEIPNFKPAHGILGFCQITEKFQCHICKTEFGLFRLLCVHTNNHNANYVCQHCGKNFISNHKLTQHMNRHEESELKFNCKICVKQFNTSAARALHVSRVHKKPVFKCPECNETFSREIKLTEHLVEAHNLKRPEYKCEICYKLLLSRRSLSRHVRVSHFKETEYACEICSMKFNYKHCLKKHMLVHSGVKDFECKFCKKSFARAHTLQVHLRMHLNEKPYSCTVCKAAFVQKVSLKNHLRVHHPDLDVKL